MHLPLVVSEPNRFLTAVRAATGGAGLVAAGVTTLQVNVGKRCNQACKHCHVDAGPARTEEMPAPVAEACLAVLGRWGIKTLDITGGAPELNPHFRRLVTGARALGATVMVRHNLTVQDSPGQHDLPAFFAANEVTLFSSLPHYTAEATDRQRGQGTFDASVRAMRALNEVGYGRGHPTRGLTLVHNPVGAFLPGGQAQLERDFRRVLEGAHGVQFDRLVSLANMPIERFKSWLAKTGQLESYCDKLEAQFNPATLPGLMCRSTLSVSHTGALFDCDFNQMLDLGVLEGPRSIEALLAEGPGALVQRSIATASHCFGCTAGAGSSCGGALT
ncbi:MAG: arsenosugar biosynthesis radical SAM protein ArsS [Myxococcales bacterium]|nr:arsenosugar biosynthesis radical SAM protein ArsS [Myxococcales bacterium]